MTDIEIVFEDDEVESAFVPDGDGQVIRIDDVHVVSMDDVRKVGYDDGEKQEPGEYVSLYTDETLYQFNHRTQYVTIMPLDGTFDYVQVPMTARSRNELARAVPLV